MYAFVLIALSSNKLKRFAERSDKILLSQLLNVDDGIENDLVALK